MLLVRAPMRVSFLGGGTDLPDFYRKHGGAVVSATINKYVHIAINSSVFSGDLILKYMQTEHVKRVSEIRHSRFREALNMFGVSNAIEIGSFADVGAGTGLGSSSTFSVALIRALATRGGSKLSREEVAARAAMLEIDILKEPIGKQDQYASACGGCNTITFAPDDSVDVKSLFLHHSVRSDFERHLVLFYTGITHDASAVLADQVKVIVDKTPLYKQMLERIPDFVSALSGGDFLSVGGILHESWELKRQFSAGISTETIDALYADGRSAGAYGGKLLGAGAGGCLLFVVPPEKRQALLASLQGSALNQGLGDAREIPFSFTAAGVETLINTDGGL